MTDVGKIVEFSRLDFESALKTEFFPSDWSNEQHALIAQRLNFILDNNNLAPYRHHFADEVIWLRKLASDYAGVTSVKTDDLRKELTRKKTVSRYYFCDFVLSEMRIQKQLHQQTFFFYQSLTLLCVTRLYLMEKSSPHEHASAIENVMREIRMIADGRRNRLLKFLLPPESLPALLDDLISDLAQKRQDSNTTKDITVSYQLGHLEVAYRDAHSRSPGVIRQGVSNTHLNRFTTVTSHPVLLGDDGPSIVQLRDIAKRKNGKQNSIPDWELEEINGASQPTTQWLVSTDPSQLNDVRTRKLQAKAVAQAISLRQQALPCAHNLLTYRELNCLTKSICSTNGVPLNDAISTAMWLMLLLGQSLEQIKLLPIWLELPKTRHPGKVKQKKYHQDGLCVVKDQIVWQLVHQVPASVQSVKLDPMLPPVQPYLYLPLPARLGQALHISSLPLVTQQDIRERLSKLNRRHDTRLTVARISHYQTQWLAQNGVDQTIQGLLRRYSSQRQAQLAYARLEPGMVASTWMRYVNHLFGEQAFVLPETLQDKALAIGSRLVPSESALRQLFIGYQRYLTSKAVRQNGRLYGINFHNVFIRHTALLLSLCTGARPVTGMFGFLENHDLVSGISWISDKEIRSQLGARLVLLPTKGREQLAFLQRHLQQLVRQFEHRAPAVSLRAKASLNNKLPLLFWLETTADGNMVPLEFTPSSYEQQMDKLLPLPPNWNRHFLRSTLMSKHLPGELIDCLMGHEDMGQELLHPASGCGLSSMKIITEAIDALLTDIGLEVWPGW